MHVQVLPDDAQMAHLEQHIKLCCCILTCVAQQLQQSPQS
jgi:hypothetical protein